MGNLRSVEKALEHVGATATITNDADEVRAADGVILPGVGAFPKAMERVRELGLDELIAERRDAGRPDPRHLPRPAAALRLDHRAGRGDRARTAPRRGRRARRRRPQESRTSAGRRCAGSASRGSPRGSTSETPFYFVHSFAPRPGARRPARHRRLRRPLRLRRRARQRLRRPVPPREVERRRPAAALQLRRGLRRASRRDPLPGDRHPRRAGGATAAGRLRAGDRLRRRPGRRGDALGRTKGPSSCTWSTSTAPRPGEPREPRGGAADRRGGRLPDPGRRRAARRRLGRARCSTPAPSAS